ncbi:MAG: hypothetical protein NXI16_10255 [Alphaproteobacteria bacterium]|nr:hypothetical protein [Alphaproteobacteria bacterium]
MDDRLCFEIRANQLLLCEALIQRVPANRAACLEFALLGSTILSDAVAAFSSVESFFDAVQENDTNANQILAKVDIERTDIFYAIERLEAEVKNRVEAISPFDGRILIDEISDFVEIVEFYIDNMIIDHPDISYYEFFARETSLIRTLLAKTKSKEVFKRLARAWVSPERDPFFTDILLLEDISLISGHKLDSVRNHASPRGDKPLFTVPVVGAADRRQMGVNLASALHWLTQTEHFYSPLALSPDQIDQAIRPGLSVAQLQALPCLYLWLNGYSSAAIAREVSVSQDDIKMISQGKLIEINTVLAIAKHAGLEHLKLKQAISESSFSFQPLLSAEDRSKEMVRRLTNQIVEAASPVLRIDALRNEKWRRDVKPTDPRYGPWHHSEYSILNQEIWMERSPCLYVVQDAAKRVRYVGKSTNRFKDRWRCPPAYMIDSDERVNFKPLFHSQCWGLLTQAFQRGEGPFTVIAISERALADLELSQKYRKDSSVSEALEKVLRRHRSNDFCDWNRI